MSKITLDAYLRAKLNGLSEQVELCDANGKTIGRFVPEPIFQQIQRIVYSWLKEFTKLEDLEKTHTEIQRIVYSWLKEHHTDAEVEELDRQTGGSTLQQIWQRLGRE